MKRKSPTTKRNTKTKSKISSGGGGLRVSRGFNLRRIFPVVIAIAAIGGYMVYHSFAASSSSLSQVTNWYQQCHGTNGDSAGREYWATRLDNEGNANSVFAAFVAAGGCNPQSSTVTPATPASPATPTSTASPNSVSQVKNWYQQCHGTNGDAAGVDYWAKRLDKEKNANSVFAAFVAAGGCNPKSTSTSKPKTSSGVPGYNASKYANLSNEDFIYKVYYELLGLAPDTVSMKDWLAKLSNGSWTRAQVYQHIAGTQGAIDRANKIANKTLYGTPEETARYYEALKAFDQYFTNKFWQAYNARGGKLGSSSTFNNLQNSCQNEIIPRVKQGIAPNWTLNICFSLVGLTPPDAADSYAKDYAHGLITIQEAINQMETLPAVYTQGCDPSSQYYTDCLADNRRKILFGKTDQPTGDKKKKGSKKSTPDRNIISSDDTSNDNTNLFKTKNDKPTTIANEVQDEGVQALLQIGDPTIPVRGGNVTDIQQEVLIETTKREHSAINALILPKCKSDATLQSGSQGDCVKRIQQLLAIIQNPKIVISGNYDATTVAEVKKFQQDRSLPSTGVVDSITRKLLEAAVDTSEHKSPLDPAKGLLSNFRAETAEK